MIVPPRSITVLPLSGALKEASADFSRAHAVTRFAEHPASLGMSDHACPLTIIINLNPASTTTVEQRGLGMCP